MSAGTFTNLADLIVFFDVYVSWECEAGLVAVPANFVYLARRDGAKRITLISRHVSLEYLNQTCAAMLDQFAAAVDGQFRLN